MDFIKHEKELLNLAVEALKNKTGLDVFIEYGNEVVADGNLDDPRHSKKLADVKVYIQVGRRKIEYLVEIKPKLDNVILARIVQRLMIEGETRLLVTQYVPPNLVRELKRLGIQFLDTRGNAYLQKKQFMVFVTGNRSKTEKTVYKNQAFARAGTMLIYAFLCKEGLVNDTYREIAETAGVALGTVAGVIEDLKRLGYLIETKNKKRKLHRKEELLQEWVRAYNTKLRPKLLIGKYEALDNAFWQHTDITLYKAWWGGEVAAHHYTKYLNPEIVTIYVNNIPREVNRIVAEQKLNRTELRNNRNIVEVREKFWNFKWKEMDIGVVPPVLVYADLLATKDIRNIETAVKIYDEYLLQHFK